jgi:hypothetical protein
LLFFENSLCRLQESHLCFLFIPHVPKSLKLHPDE